MEKNYKHLILLCGLFVAFSNGNKLIHTANPRLEIPDLGAVIGETVHYTRDEYPTIDTHIDVFRGIPFAEPPLGQLRFAKPVPAAPFTEDYNATYFRSPCNQLGGNETNDGEEDCLHLSVFTPNPRIPDAAVILWIHGGGFLLGDATGVNDDGVPLVGFNGVVHVAIHYRLNSFGFLATGDPELPGNYGMWDQKLAIQWVQSHIAAFGGNPDNIMIFGLSAGGGSVGLHLLSPHSWPHFNRAIIESGTGTSPWVVGDIDKARSDAMRVGEDCGCDTSSSAALAECLRETPMGCILEATNKIVLTITNVLPFVPVVDHDFIPDNPTRLIQQGKFKQCEIIVGTAKDEGTLFAMRAFPEQIPRRNPFIPRSRWDTMLPDYVYSYSNDVIIEGVNQQYVDWTVADDPDANFFWFFVDMNTDEAFACPSDTYARAWSEHGNDAYLYQFNHIPSNQNGLPSWQGVAHGSELQFVFGVPLNPLSDLEQTPEEINMTMYLMRAWTNFAKTGDPNSDPFTSPNMESFWPAFSLPELHYKELAPTMPNKQGLKADECHFWNDYVPKMVTFAGDLEESERQWREEFYSWKHEDMPDWQEAFDNYQELKPPCKN